MIIDTGRTHAGSLTLIRCTVVYGHQTRDVEISAAPETEAAAILAALPFDLAVWRVYCGQVPLARKALSRSRRSHLAVCSPSDCPGHRRSPSGTTR